MLVAAALLVLCARAGARNFSITYLDVPGHVAAQQKDVILECRYDATFTVLSWYKGPHEFFRYRPRKTPSTHSFPISGVGRVEMVSCDPLSCVLRLGELTEEATGLYRCDIERDTPPYKFATLSAHMKVFAVEHRSPLLEGLTPEYTEGELIQAYCRVAPGSVIRWYINGEELENMKNSPNLRIKSTRILFKGVPPVVNVQCAEFRDGHVHGSRQHQARWREDQNHLILENNSTVLSNRLGLLLLCVLVKIF